MYAHVYLHILRMISENNNDNLAFLWSKENMFAHKNKDARWSAPLPLLHGQYFPFLLNFKLLTLSY